MSERREAETSAGKTLLEALDTEKAAHEARKAKTVVETSDRGRGLRGLSMKQKKFAMLGVAVALAIAVLSVVAMRGGSTYFLSIKELRARGSSTYGERVRIGGFVKDGTIKSSPGRMITEFVVADKKGGASAQVTYKGVVPDNFGNSVEVVLDGSYDGSIFAADNMLTKCPSKYKAAKE